MSLITYGTFKSHSGLPLPWKIDCDALTDEDLAALARVVTDKFKFGRVHGIVRGGVRFADALRQYGDMRGRTMIVDDVLTTGASMLQAHKSFRGEFLAPIGIVIFARGPVPDWVFPIFTLNEWTQEGWGV